MADTKHGYLVLADIGGYTGFLAQVELTHADEILTDLLAGIVDSFRSILTISKLEGDAVFANVDEERLARPESLLELIEKTYLGFRRRRDSSQRATTCTCRACQSMSSLELKFFVHHGDYIVQNIAGNRELVGSDVNLIHRLMKNRVTEDTGWTAYLLFTQAALDRIDLQLEGLHRGDEFVEHLGTIQTQTLNLSPRFDDLISAQRVTVPQDKADVIFTYDFNAPLALIWDWITDIQKRNQAMGALAHWRSMARNKGRTEAGASNHCSHGKGAAVETILDWRPFQYSTVDTVDGKVRFREMLLFTSIDEGQQTRVEARIQMHGPLPLFIARLMVKWEFSRANPYKKWFSQIEKQLANESES